MGKIPDRWEISDALDSELVPWKGHIAELIRESYQEDVNKYNISDGCYHVGTQYFNVHDGEVKVYLKKRKQIPIDT